MMPVLAPVWPLLVLCAAEVKTPQIVIVIPRPSSTASIAASHLEDELAVSARVVSTDLELAREQWPDAWVIERDMEKNEAALLRPDDPALLVRSLSSQKETSPYALATAAAELVRLAMLEFQRAPPPPVEEETELGVAVSIALGLSAAPGFERALAQPMFGADLRARTGSLIASLGIVVRGPAGTQEGDALLVRYRRTDLSARIAFGPELGAWSIFGVLECGTSFTSVRAERGTEVVGASTRRPFWIGGGGEVEYQLWRSLRAMLVLEAAGVLSPADFVGNGAILVAEGGVRLQLAAGLAWVLE